MKWLLQQVKIIDPNSVYHESIQDILIEGNTILAIDKTLNIPVDAKLIDAKGLSLSIGFVDVFANFCDPGFEYKETLLSGATAALKGGFTKVLMLPNTKPTIDNAAQITYLLQKSAHLPIHIYPIGSVSKNIEGKTLAELYDMDTSGAIAFSDGYLPVQNPALMLKALQYTTAIDGIIIQTPIEKTMNGGGLMHEGVVSTQLGLAGMPAIAEDMLIERDINLVRYTNSHLHFTGVSTATGITLIKNAKLEGLPVTCSVTPYHLFYTDEALKDYDTNLKVNPPIRTAIDRAALQEAVITGIVDCIATHHSPQNWDNKACEFEYALDGMIGLQTAFSMVCTALPTITEEYLVKLFTTNAHRIFKLSPQKIELGQTVEMTLFSCIETSIFTKENNASLSQNFPNFDSPLKGKIKGVFSKNNYFLYS